MSLYDILDGLKDPYSSTRPVLHIVGSNNRYYIGYHDHYTDRGYKSIENAKKAIALYCNKYGFRKPIISA